MNKKKKKKKTTRERAKKALKFIDLKRKSDYCHNKAIEDIVTVLAKEKYMSPYIAIRILDDVKEIIPLISEIKLL